VEFLVEFEVSVPDEAPASELEARNLAEASAAARLVDFCGCGSPRWRLAKPRLSACTKRRVTRSSSVYWALCHSTTG
jgi:hypothetical protein